MYALVYVKYVQILLIFAGREKAHYHYIVLYSAGFSFDGIVEQLNQSLSQLQTDYVDIFYLHQPNRDFSIEETLKACDHLHKRKTHF